MLLLHTVLHHSPMRRAIGIPQFDSDFFIFIRHPTLHDIKQCSINARMSYRLCQNGGPVVLAWSFHKPPFHSHFHPILSVDCIDCAAEPAVVLAAHQGIQAAMAFSRGARLSGSQSEASARSAGGNPSLGSPPCSPLPVRPVAHPPWLMVSVSDDEDLHFRKAGERSITV